MTRLVLAFLWIFSSTVWGQLEISPVESTLVHPGEVVSVQVFLTDKELFNKLTPQHVKSFTLPEAFWVMSVSPWELRDGKLVMEARAVLGNKFSTSDVASATIGGRSVAVLFRDWNFQAGAKQQSAPLEYLDLPWYRRPWWLKHWHLVLACVSLILGCGLWYGRKHQLKRRRLAQLQSTRQDWIDQIEAAKDFSALAKIWERRDELLSAFEAQDAQLREFFSVLNRYQFKPAPGQDDLQAVLVGKQRLTENLRAGAHGV